MNFTFLGRVEQSLMKPFIVSNDIDYKRSLFDKSNFSNVSSTPILVLLDVIIDWFI